MKRFHGDASISCRDSLSCTPSSLMIQKHTRANNFVSEVLLLMARGFYKRWNRKLDGITRILLYFLPVFNPFAESIPAQTRDNRFIWDNVHVATRSPLLSEAKGSNNPSLFTMGMLNNASRCVWKPAEMRTGFPAGSLNLFFLPRTHSYTLSVHSAPLSAGH